MDMCEFEKKLALFGEAHGRALFAARAAAIQEKRRAQKYIDDARKQNEKKQKIVINEYANNLEREYRYLKENLSNFYCQDQTILQAAEYIELGKIRIQGMDSLVSNLREIPYIVPLLGHGSVFLFGSDTATDQIAASILWKAFASTAPGQLNVMIYNPSLKNNFAIYSGIEQIKTITTAEVFLNELEAMSQTIVSVDSLLKSDCQSLLDLRQKSEQPVGNLTLVILNSLDFMSDEKTMTVFARILTNCHRAGISFIGIGGDRNAEGKLKDLGNVTILRQSGQKWNELNRDIDIYPDSELPSNIPTLIQEYIKQAENTSVVTIPFSSIEERTEWTEYSGDNLRFALGKSGLDTVTVELGDAVTQFHNILISGAAGKGKSNLLEVMIHSLCARYNTDEVELYLLDFKDGLTFKPYSDIQGATYLPHARVLGLESERDFGLAVLQHLENVRKERAGIFSKAEASDISKYRKKFPTSVMPRIVLVIDEFQKLFDISDDIGNDAADLLENLARQGRACGIHIVLASQTIHGAAALINREDKIYAQFPIRIALQNSLTESYATFTQGNDGAAKLRVRGEAIINVNYGDINSNQKFTVSYADADVLKTLRKQWCGRINGDNHYPVVFRKNDQCHISDVKTSIRQWRKQIITEHIAPMLPFGTLVSVDRKVLAIRITNDAGRNVAILGAGDDAQNPEVMSNNAIGMLQSMAVSLALQHPEGDARFTLINAIDKTTYTRNGMDAWLGFMQRLGFYVDVVEQADAGSFFGTVTDEISKNLTAGENHYILCAGMDRCTTLNRPVEQSTDEPKEPLAFPSISLGTTKTGINLFQTVLEEGSQAGVHIISWWSNPAVYKQHIGFTGDGFINTKVILRLDGSTTQSILDVYTKWSVQNNRALIHDGTDLSGNETVIPFVPITQRDIGILSAEEWDV